VGRSHIGATVNTLFLAYVGVGLPLLVTIVVSNQPAALVFNSEEVATEVIRTLVGSLGILAAVPLTTVVAAFLADRPAPGEPSSAARRRGLAGVGLGAAVVALALTATAVLPLGQGRSALPIENLGSSAVPGLPSDQQPPDNAPLPTDARASDNRASASDANAQPDVVSEGSPYLLTTGDGATIEITVTSITHVTVATKTALTVTVEYRNDGGSPFTIDPAAWSLVTARGEDVQLQPTAGNGLESQDLDPGASATGRLGGTVRASLDDTFIAFTGPDGVLTFAVPANGT
jgi:hypothetical protein